MSSGVDFTALRHVFEAQRGSKVLIDRARLEKITQKWLERHREDNETRRKTARMLCEIQRVAREIRERYDIDLKAGTKLFAGELRRYKSLRHLISTYHDYFPPAHLADVYEYCKKLSERWNIDDLRKFKSEYSSIWKLTREESVAKLIVDIAREYVLLFEWVAAAPNQYVYVLTDRGPARVPTTQIFWGVTFPSNSLDELRKLQETERDRIAAKRKKAFRRARA